MQLHPALKALGVNSLLADPQSNPKVAKNGKLGVLTAPLHLAPARLSGFEVCPMRTAGCTAGCLNTAGNPAYAKGKARARLARTKAYFEHRDLFMMQLIHEIELHVARAKKQNMEAAVRLNATSDIPWERIRFAGKTIPERFPDVQFYDYTKVTKRALACARGDRDWPTNYHLTFSLAEGNDADADAVLEAGGTVAAVFAVKRGKPLPTSFILHSTLRHVVDADEHDYRPIDPRGAIAGLRAKGDAIGDTSGFVRSV